LNGFEKNIIVCSYIIFYELFILNFIIKVYYVILKKIHIWTKHEKDNDGERNKMSSKHCCWNVLKCKIYLQFFSIQVLFSNFYNFVV